MVRFKDLIFEPHELAKELAALQSLPEVPRLGVLVSYRNAIHATAVLSNGIKVSVVRGLNFMRPDLYELAILNDKGVDGDSVRANLLPSQVDGLLEDLQEVKDGSQQAR